MTDGAAMMLARVAIALRAGVVPARGDALTLASAFDAWRHGEATLDELLGLKRGPGQRKASTVALHDRRDRLVREAAARFFPDLSQRAQASQLHSALQRYAATGWRSDRAQERCPRRPGTLQAACWAILKVRDRVPSQSTIRWLTSSGISLATNHPSLNSETEGDQA